MFGKELGDASGWIRAFAKLVNGSSICVHSILACRLALRGLPVSYHIAADVFWGGLCAAEVGRRQTGGMQWARPRRSSSSSSSSNSNSMPARRHLARGSLRLRRRRPPMVLRTCRASFLQACLFYRRSVIFTFLAADPGLSAPFGHLHTCTYVYMEIQANTGLLSWRFNFIVSGGIFISMSPAGATTLILISCRPEPVREQWRLPQQQADELPDSCQRGWNAHSSPRIAGSLGKPLPAKHLCGILAGAVVSVYRLGAPTACYTFQPSVSHVKPKLAGDRCESL